MMKKYFVYLNVFLLIALFLPGAKPSALASAPDLAEADVPKVIETGIQGKIQPVSLTQTEEPEWTWQNPLPQGNSLDDIWGSGPNDLFAVGNYGTILHYDGDSWAEMKSSITTDLNGVWGSSPNDVFAVGGGWDNVSGGQIEYYGVILHYDGNEWQEIEAGEITYLYDVWSCDDNSVFAVGINGTILHYNGRSWTEMNSGTDVSLTSIWGSSDNNIFAVGGGRGPGLRDTFGMVLHYNGYYWSEIGVDDVESLYGIWGADATDIFAVGWRGTILHYDGNEWTPMNSGTLYGLRGVWGRDSDDVFAVGSNSYSGESIILHYNNGVWSEMETSIEVEGAWASGAYGMWGSGNDFYAVGGDGTILHYDGNVWSEMSSGPYCKIYGIWGSSSYDVFAVGGTWDEGIILHYDGNTWHETSVYITARLRGVWGLNSEDVFAVGDGGAIFHYNGYYWIEMASGVTATLYGVWGSSNDDVFAVGSQGTILHYNGDNWREMEDGTTETLYGIWGSDSDNVFSVGGGGIILHYDGSIWSSMNSTATRLGDVWGSGPNDVFAVGSSTILHYDGSIWSSMNSNTPSLGDVWGSGPNHVFAVGYDGNAFQYDGHEWFEISKKTDADLYDVWGSGSNSVFVVGDSGTILHYGIQPQQGTINGRVTSTTGDVGLSNVTVAARTYSTTTDLNGNYSLVVSPGVYQVKATPNAGMDYYANQRSFITVDNGESVTVDLKLSPITSDTVDTLILANLQRMKDIGYDAGGVDELETKIGELQSTHPDDSNMTAIFTDLGESVSPEIDAAYTAWDGNEGDVTKTNDLVDSIDAYIESLKQGDYPNLEYVIIVGSHEVIPMKARAADSGEENEWAETPGHLPVHSGYLYEIYRSQEKGARGHYLTDSQYGDLSFIDNGDTRGCDGELVPEIYVGRLVETPSQIAGLVDAYISNQGILSREKMVSIASVDLLDSGTVAAEYMGGTADLIQLCFSSHAVVDKMEENPGIVYLAGHSDYYRTATCKSGEMSAGTFHAGTQAGQGSVQDISVDLPGTLIVSVGCHNGLNLGNQRYQAPDGESQWSDFPEEFAKKEVGVFFGSTGIALGSESGEGRSHHTVGNSERLATNILYFLLNGNNVSAGEAFKDAINFFVAHNEVCGDEQNRVLAIATLYGFPHYRLPSNVTITVSGSEANLRMSTLTQNTWPIEVEIPSWKLSERGVVTIPSVSYMDNINTPILPVISLRRLLPTGSIFTSVSWNQNESESITMTNDVPLPVIGMPAIGTGENITITGTFTYTGDYPEFPYFTTDISDVGGGRWINLQVVPVQYNQTTHITRIWTRLSFDVEYDIASSVDSDGDGLPDYWEKAYGLDPLNDSGDSGSDADIDGDGLTNAEEYSYSTNPTSADTDDDGVQDQTEIGVGTDPNNPFSKADLVFLPIVTRNY